MLTLSEFFRLAIEHVNGSDVEAGRKSVFTSFCGFGQKEGKQSSIARRIIQQLYQAYFQLLIGMN
jgi:hypothetical protein